MLKIGEFSKLAQVSPKALRLYDERGLLRPAWTDRFSGYRYYAPQQLARLHSILALKDLGFSLDQIAGLLDGGLAPDTLAEMMRTRKGELSRHINAEQARLLRVEARLQQLERVEALPGYDVVMKPVRPLTVAGLRRRLDTQAELPALLDEARRELRLLGVIPTGPVPVLGIYYDDVYRERDLDVEAAIPLQGRLPRGAGFSVHDLPGEEMVASAVHRGPISLLPAAYEAVLTWLYSSGYQPAGPSRDLFLQPPAAGETQDQVVTEVQFPARPKPYMSAVATTKDKKEMEVKIVTQPAFTVVGLPYYGKNENKEIAEVWDVLMPRCAEVGHRTGVAYGLCSEAEADGRFRYLAGYAVSEVGELPEGMESQSLPERTYAAVPCKLDTIGEAYQLLFEQWLPQSGYEFAGGFDFELYPQEFSPHTGEETMYVYIPVKKK